MTEINGAIIILKKKTLAKVALVLKFDVYFQICLNVEFHISQEYDTVPF